MDVAMVSSSGSLCDRRDRVGLGPRGSKPRARGFFFFGFSGEGVFTSSSTFAGFRKSLAKRPGFGGLALSTTTASTGSEGVLGERGILVVLGCLGAASPRARRGERRRDVQCVLPQAVSPYRAAKGLALVDSASLASVLQAASEVCF